MSSFAGTRGAPQKVRVSQRVGANLRTLLEFDVVLSEAPTTELDVTDHPIERGSDITDHLRLRPLTLDMTALVSNRPIEFLASQGIGIRGGSPLERAEDAYREITRWQSEGLLLTIKTTLRTYENLILQRATPTRDAANGQVLRVSLSFREIFTAETKFDKVPVTEQPQQRRRTNKGRKTKTDPAKPEVEASADDRGSTLSGWVNRAFGAE